MRDDHRLPTPLTDARGYLRAYASWAIWLPLLIGFIGAEGVIRYLEAKFAIPRFPIPIRPGTILIYFAAVILGARRASVFHPQSDESYREWLSRTPWTAAKPLPRGPISLAWFDGLTVGGLILIGAFAPDITAIQIVNTFLFVHCLVVVILTLATGTFAPAYLSLLLLGLMPRFWTEPWICVAFGVVSYLSVYWGIRRSLNSFPWPTPEENGPLSKGVARALDGEKKNKLGWPYERLLIEPTHGPDSPRFVAHALMACLLIAWWISCLAARARDPVDFLDGMRLLGYAIAAFGSLIRLGVYVSGYAPPINLAGRIGARRLIVPGYDAAFLAYPLMLLTPETVTQIGGALGLSPMVYAPIIPPLVLFIALTTPPGLRQWRLTGRHRMVAAISAQDKNYVKVG